MTRHPCTSLLPFADHIDIRLFGRDDALQHDAALQQALGTEQLVSLRQTHGHDMLIAQEPSFREQEADGAWTTVPGLTLSVRSADCQTFLAYHPHQRILGVLHVGWRGLLNGAIPSFFAAAQSEWHIDPASLLICAGPSLCLQCSAFSDPIRELPGIDARFFHGNHADLRAIAEDQLVAAGMLPAHFERHPACTRCDSDAWFSYRKHPEEVKEGYGNVLTGRMII